MYDSVLVTLLDKAQLCKHCVGVAVLFQSLHVPSPSEEMMLLLPLWGSSPPSLRPLGAPTGNSSSRECSSSRERTSPRPHDDEGGDRERGEGPGGGDGEAPEGEGGAGSGISLESWRKDHKETLLVEIRFLSFFRLYFEQKQV